MKKLFSFIATFSLLVNSLFAPLSVLAQETPSPEPSATLIAEETITPSPEPSASPTNTPEEIPSQTVSPTPVSSMVSSPTPTPTDTPIATQSPESNPTVQGPPTETPVPSITPTNSPEAPSEDGKISAVILQNEKVDDSVLADFDLSYSEDGSATISTDKLDYSPTDTAVISGTGFVAGKDYTINITSSDDPVVDFSDSVTANDKGEILYSYTLDGIYRPDYQVKILDGERVVAETTFTDSRWIIGATINGSLLPTVQSGSTVNASVRILTVQIPFIDTNSNWKSTSYQINSLSPFCINTNDHNGNSINTEGFTFNAPTLPGIYSVTFKAFAKDNCSSGESLPFIVGLMVVPAPDNSPPVITLLGNSLEQVELGSTYTDAGATAIDDVDGNLTSNIITTNNVDTSTIGTYTVTYDVSDTAENPAIQVIRTVDVVDTTAPTIPTDGQPNNVFLNTGVFDLTWTPSIDVSPVTYEYHSSRNPNQLVGVLTNVEFSQSGLTVPTIHSSGTPEGTWYWQVRAKDSSNNTSAWSDIWKATIDTTAPAIPTGIYFRDTVNNKDVACGGITSAKNFDVYWNANTEPDFDHYEYTSYNTDGNTGLVNHIFTTNHFNASWWTVPTEGTYGVQIRAVDTAGNKSAWSGETGGYSYSCQYTTDWTAPVVVIAAPTASLLNGTVEVRGTVTDEHLHHYWLYITKNGNPIVNKTVNRTDSFTNTLLYSLTDDGNYIVTLAARDAAGGTSNSGNRSINITKTFTIDNTAPIISFDEPLSGFYSGNIHLKATCNEECDYINFWWRADGESYDSASKRYHYIYNNGTNFEWDLNSLSAQKWDGSTYVLTDGIYHLYAAGKDVVGNWAKTSDIQVTIDNTPPSGTWASPVDGSTVSGTATLNFAATDNLSGIKDVVYKYKAVGETDFRTDGNIVGSTWVTTGLPLGEYVVRAVVTDKADNVAGDAGEFDITVGVAALVSNEQSTTPTETSAIITWTTDRPTSSRVVYGKTPGVTLDPSLPNYGYAASTPTTDVSPHVLSHSVTINGLSDGTVYYFRTISEGSPTAIGGEHDFKTLTYAGGGSSGGDGGAAVLGTTTDLSTSWPKLAYVETGEENTVLGAETDSVTVPSVLGATNEDQEKGGLGNWITTHKGLSLGIAFVVFGLSLLIIKKRKKD